MKCNDRTDTRSSKKTTRMINGKLRRWKILDTEGKNCIFPFKYQEGQGKGRKKLEKVSKKECVKDKYGAWCATERDADCNWKKIGYCL